MNDDWRYLWAVDSVPSCEVSLRPEQARALLRYRGAVSDEGIDRLQELARHASDYYGYREVRLELDSSGGSATAVMRWLAWSRHWRQRRGVRLRTAAHGQACSAAALMLSAGDWGVRSARPDTLLLYHSVRVLPSAALTESVAKRLGEQLRRFDDQLPEALLQVPHAAVGEAGLAQALRARAQWLSDHWARLPQRLQAAGSAYQRLPARAPAWAQLLLKAGDHAARLRALRRALKAAVERDEPMSPLQAWAWCLIDEVSGVLPFVDAPQAQPSPAPEDAAHEAEACAPVLA